MVERRMGDEPEGEPEGDRGVARGPGGPPHSLVMGGCGLRPERAYFAFITKTVME